MRKNTKTKAQIKGQIISFRLTEEEADRLRALADSEHRSLPGQIRHILDPFIVECEAKAA